MLPGISALSIIGTSVHISLTTGIICLLKQFHKLFDKEKEYSCKVFFEHKTRRNDREMSLLNLSMEHLVFVCCSCTPFCPAQLPFCLLQCPSFDLAFPVCGGPGGSRVLLRSGLPRMLQLWCQILVILRAVFGGGSIELHETML